MDSKRALAAKTQQDLLVKTLGPRHSSSAMTELLHPSDGSTSLNEKPSFNFRPSLTKLGAGKSMLKYKSDAFVFSQGDRADSVFYLQNGKIKITVVSKRGKEAVVAILPEGSFFGEGCLTGQPLRLATASTVQASSVIRVKKLVMERLLRDEPDFAAQFLAYLLSRNVRMESDLVDHLFNNSEKRLARLLLILANYGKKSKSKPMIAKMSQETLAKMIGTTRSRVSFFMNRFREKGYIKYNGGMHIDDSLVSVLLRD